MDEEDKKKVYKALYGEFGENPSSTLRRILGEDKIDPETFDKLEKRLAATMNDLPTGFSEQDQGGKFKTRRNHFNQPFRHPVNGPAPGEEIIAHVSDGIELHDDVWEYLELTGHPIVFSWFSRLSYTQHPEARLVVISYVEPMMAPRVGNFMSQYHQTETITELEMRYRVKALFENRCPVAILIHSPDRAIELIENTVNKVKVDDYDPPKRTDYKGEW